MTQITAEPPTMIASRTAPGQRQKKAFRTRSKRVGRGGTSVSLDGDLAFSISIDLAVTQPIVEIVNAKIPRLAPIAATSM